MLLQFSVSNYRAFRDLQTLNLAASNYDKALPENYITPDLPGLKNRRWVKGAAIYGANAVSYTHLTLPTKASNASIRVLLPLALAP